MRIRVVAFLSLLSLTTLTFLLEQRSSAQTTVRLVSPALYAFPGDFLQCKIVNASETMRTVTIRVFDSNGNVVTQTAPLSINPNGTSGISLSGFSGGTTCEFTTDGRPNFYRASIEVLAGDGSGTKVALSVPLG